MHGQQNVKKKKKILLVFLDTCYPIYGNLVETFMNSEPSETDLEALVVCLKTPFPYSPFELKELSKSLSIDGPGIQCGDFQ